MADFVKAYRQSVPAMRFIGKKYFDEDRVNGGFGEQWREWFANGWFEELEKNSSAKSIYEDGDATIGLMRWKDGEPFEYWIGAFFSKTTKVPEGYLSVDFNEAALGVIWVYGRENEVFGQENQCADYLEKQGYKIIADEKGAYWFFERYVCPRFTTPDEKGNVILDICHFIDRV